MIIVLEGVDGVGKSTVGRMLNEQLPLSNFLKLSGAPKEVDSQEWMRTTYESLVPFLSECGSKSHIILDRAWPSEAVYPRLFKHYRAEYIDLFAERIHKLAPTHYIFLYASLETIKERILAKQANQPNEKHPDMATVKVVQDAYSAWFMEFASRYPDNCHSVNTDLMTPEDIALWIMSRLQILPTDLDTTYSSVKNA